MKSSLFIVFLSFSACLAIPKDIKDDKTNNVHAINDTTLLTLITVKPTETNKVEAKANASTPTTKLDESNKTTPHKQETSTKNFESVETKPTTIKVTDKKPIDATTKSDKHLIPAQTDKQEVEPKQDKYEVVPKDAKHEQKLKKNETTTPKTESTSRTSVTTAKTTTEAVSDKTPTAPLEARGFSGSSFVGGIILTLGLMALGFIGYKYYTTERDYHTL